jgi:hypothetical protein
VDFSDALFEYPLSIISRRRHFVLPNGHPVDESMLAGSDPVVRMVSLRGVDAAHLGLTDVNLSECLFAGTVHLDQVRLEGDCDFAHVPAGVRWHGWRPARWSPRRTLAEEQHWRASRHIGPGGWIPTASTDSVGPAALVAVYRQLRKSFEDAKDEPGAADFYYGEMEMRRNDVKRPRVERALLVGYWAMSGYGLRASRALSWLLLAMTTTVLAMMLWGLPQHDPEPSSTGSLTGQSIRLVTNEPDSENPIGPLHERLTTKRFEKGLRVVMNSVIFRSSAQNLTTAGTYTEMASRLTEPVLLGLAVLAVRGRVKR